jgi:hypothetical protein
MKKIEDNIQYLKKQARRYYQELLFLAFMIIGIVKSQ